jgi:hypothetical protein
VVSGATGGTLSVTGIAGGAGMAFSVVDVSVDVVDVFVVADVSVSGWTVFAQEVNAIMPTRRMRVFKRCFMMCPLTVIGSRVVKSVKGEG